MSESSEMNPEWHVSMSDTTTCSGEHQIGVVVKLTSECAPRDPHILSCAVGTFSGVAIDRQLTLVYEQDVCCVGFGSVIDDFGLLEGGFVAVAERSGTVSLGVVRYGQFRVTLNYKLCSPNSDGRTFTRLLFIKEPGDTERARVTVLTADSTLVVSQNIIVRNGDIDMSEVEVKQAATPPGQVRDVAAEGDTVVAVGPEGLWVFGMDDEGLSLQEAISLDDISDAELTKVHILGKTCVFITMDAAGEFHLWDQLTLTFVCTWHVDGALDFRPVVEQEDCFSLQKLRLIVLTDDGVQTLALPSLEAAFSCSLPGNQAALTRCHSTQDDVLLVQCHTVEDLVEETTTVSLASYAEASPQKRLSRLLARRRFSEAEQLAKLYGLSYDIDPSIIQSQMREAKETFQETLDHLDSCRLQLRKNKSGNVNVKFVLDELEEVEYRLKAYRMVFGEDNFSPEEWLMFQFENPLKLCSKLIALDPDKAFTLWECFQEDLKKQLTPGIIGQMLMSLPSDVPGGQVIEWLCASLVPTVCGIDPHAVGSITDWVSSQLLTIEKADQSSWPDEAITLTTKLLASLKAACHCSVNDLQLLPAEVVQTKLSNARSLQTLGSLVQLLEELKELSSKFKFSISLHRLKQETKESLVFCMLSHVPTANLLPSVLRGTVLPYIKSRKLVADEVFAKYVEHLVQHQEMSRQNRGRGSCEEMVKAIIENITSPKEKVAAVLNLVQHIALPVPDFVPGLVEDTLASIKHPLCKSLKEQWSIKEASNIMRKNGINFADVVTSMHVLEVARYLLSQGQSFPVVRKVLTAYNAGHRETELHTFACRLKVERGQVDELVEMINGLPKKCAVKCCQFVIFTAKHMTVEDEQPKLVEAMKAVQLLYFEAALRVSNVLLSMTEDYFIQVEVIEQRSLITQLRDLQLHYNIVVSAATLSDRLKCRSLFAAACGHYRGFNLLRLSNLLNLSGSDLVQILLSKVADQANEMELISAEKLIRLVCQGYEGLQLSTACVHSVLELLEKPCTDQRAMLELCLKLTGVLATHCEPDQCQENVELSKLVTLARDMTRLTQPPEPAQKEAADWDPDILVETCEHAGSGAGDKSLDDLVDVGSLALLQGHTWTEETGHELSLLIEDLAKQGQSYLALRVFYFVMHASVDSCADASKDHLSFLSWDKRLTCGIIKKLLMSAKGSQKMALTFALSLSPGESVPLIKSVIKSCGTDYKNLKRVSAVAGAYAEILADEGLIKSCTTVKVLAKWGTRLAKIGINFKVNDKIEALEKLVESPYCTVDILKEYFKDFKLDGVCLQSHFALYLSHLLERDLDLATPTQRQASDILKAMADPLPLLHKLLKRASPYNYEQLRFLLSEVQAREGSSEVEKGLELLRYLDKYTRRCPPSPTERRTCCGSGASVPGGDAGVVPPLDVSMAAGDFSDDIGNLDLLPECSQVRLPYHMLMRKDMTVIKPEVTMDTLDAWLDMAPVLDVTRDYVLLRSVINIMDSYSSSSAGSTPSQATSAEFRDLLAKVSHVMTLFARKEYALWCSNSLMEKLMNVEEKKLALQGCIRFTQNLLESVTDAEERSKSQKALDMFSKRLLLLSTKSLLMHAGLWEAVAAKVNQEKVVDLIRDIYDLDLEVLRKADANTVVDSIGDLHGIDVTSVRLSLVQEWLAGGDMTLDLDQTMTFDVVRQGPSEHEDTVSKVVMLLESRDGESIKGSHPYLSALEQY